LVVGDIHGCLLELEELVQQAALDFSFGDAVLAAGDLVAKGPHSRGVVQWLMRGGHFAVLGNHDLAVLKNALLRGRLDHSGQTYQTNEDIREWNAEEVEKAGGPNSAHYADTFYARMNGHSTVAAPHKEHYKIAGELSDDELHWLAHLPLTIDLSAAFPSSDAASGFACASSPASSAASASSAVSAAAASSVAASSVPTVAPAVCRWTVCHAGMAPGVPVHAQHCHHLTTMRNVLDDDTQTPVPTPKVGHSWAMETRTPNVFPAAADSAPLKAVAAAAANSIDSIVAAEPSTHAAAPAALPPILFGHDAARGFQYPRSERLGLDTGACNGRFLTGLLLPSARLVSVRSHAVYRQPNKPLSRIADAQPPPAEAEHTGGVPLARVPFAPVAHAQAQQSLPEDQTAAPVEVDVGSIGRAQL
jgi:hypothetical protein